MYRTTANHPVFHYHDFSIQNLSACLPELRVHDFGIVHGKLTGKTHSASLAKTSTSRLVFTAVQPYLTVLKPQAPAAPVPNPYNRTG